MLRRHIPVPAVSGYYVALTVWSNHDEDSFFFTVFFSCTSPSNDYLLYNILKTLIVVLDIRTFMEQNLNVSLTSS